MKNNLKKAVGAVSLGFICIGLIICVIGANNGGSIMRAMKYNNTKPNNKYEDHYNQYNYGSSDSAEDQMREFFRQFGMSDDEIDMFVNPGGSGKSSQNGKYHIQ